MKKYLILSLIIPVLTACIDVSNQEEDTPKTETTALTEGVFIHISRGYDDPHRVLMPMKMAVTMASDREVLVYLDIDAVKLTVKEADDLEMEGFESFQNYLAELRESNIGVYACPTCLQVAGFSPSDLREGIQPAQKDVFFNFASGRILTLDY